jgi:hypothetical protein
MKPVEPSWEALAKQLEEALRKALGGGTKPGTAVRTLGGPIRARGSGVRPRGLPNTGPQGPGRLVVVVLPPEAKTPPQPPVSDNDDVYFVVQDKHWAILGERELNPKHAVCGHELLLKNLKPDLVLLPQGEGRPDWCEETVSVDFY